MSAFDVWVKQFGRDSATSTSIGELVSLRLAYNAGLERAAEILKHHKYALRQSEWTVGFNDACDACAAAIRAEKGE